MIFVSFGTHNQRFDRLATAINKYAIESNEEIIIQFGFTAFNFDNRIKAFDYCSREEMQKYVNDASILVLQGGWGAISEAIDLKKRIVVVPRIVGIEHIHNQIQLVKKLEALGCVLGVYDIQDLSTKIEEAKTYDFKPLHRGTATMIIKNKINEWFPKQ